MDINKTVSKRARGRRIFDKSIAITPDEPNSATPGGMLCECVDDPASVAWASANVSIRAGGRGIFDQSIAMKQDKPNSATPGGVGVRVCREPVISADGFCKPVDIRRLAGRAPSSMVLSNKSIPNSHIVTIGDGRPT